jgi:hypothetical protein
MPSGIDQSGSYNVIVEAGPQSKPKPIAELISRIDAMDKECNDRISDLEKRTNQMIELVSDLSSRADNAATKSLAHGLNAD